MRTKAILLAVTALALIAASTAAASTTSYTDGPLTATFSAGTHHPNCKQKWPVTVTARYRGRPAHATAFYQFLANGSVVGRVNVFKGTRRNRHNRLWHFYNRFTDNTFGPFGALAVGEPVTVRAVVSVGRYTAYPSYSVDVVHVRGCHAVR
ncbi:MAG: hypothetical protein ACRDNJ_11190 [Solirubrobacteraceae bacterium]